MKRSTNGIFARGIIQETMRTSKKRTSNTKRCPTCDRRYLISGGLPKHQATLACRARSNTLDLERRGYTRCGASATTLKKMGFEVVYVLGAVVTEHEPERHVYVLAAVPMARCDVVLACSEVTRIIHLNPLHKINGPPRWNLIRRVLADPSFAEVLESVQTLGGKIPAAWCAPL